MNIAFISYEYPPETALGGIGTYVYQAAHMMKDRGHRVEVFAGAMDTDGQQDEEGILTHRIKVDSRKAFARAVLPVFTQRHEQIAFDIMEGPEHKAEAYHITASHPDLPCIVKLHTPSFLLGRLHRNVSVIDKARFLLGGVLSGKLHKPYWHYRYQEDPEYTHTVRADGICSPSRDLKRIISKEWSIPASNIHHLPYPFVPRDSFLSIPIQDKESSHFHVSFIGRLEKRKGILDIIKAIPRVLQQYPEVTFTFVGGANPSPDPSLGMEEYLLKELNAYEGKIRILGKLPYEKIAEMLAHTDICIFPSLWENFPNVCLEAMSAGRAVIGSQAGGMADMITHGENGLLIPPANAEALAQAMLQLIKRPELIKEYGEKARERIQEAYNAEVIGKMTEDYYHRIIEEKKVSVPQFA